MMMLDGVTGMTDPEIRRSEALCLFQKANAFPALACGESRYQRLSWPSMTRIAATGHVSFPRRLLRRHALSSIHQSI